MRQRKPLPQHLNICLVAQKFPTKGRAAVNAFLWPIARGLSQRGHNVTVISKENPQHQAEFKQDNLRAFYLADIDKKFKRYRFAKSVRIKFSELHNQLPFHIIHSIDSSGIDIALNKNDYRVSVAFDVQATQMAQLFAILGMAKDSLRSLLRTDIALIYKFISTYFGGDRQIIKTADGIFVTSPQQKILLERYYAYPDSRIYSVPYGIELADLSKREDSTELKTHLNIPESGHTIVTITDMTDLEEIRNLLFAFEKVAIKKPKSRLIIVGNGPRRKDIEFETYNLALGSKVIFTGAVSNMELSDYIAIADVFINLSSRTTGFEPSMLEAMAQKKVVIGSEVNAIANIIEDGVNGFLLRPADIQSLSNLLIDMFTGRLLTVEIGDKARRKIMDLFDTEKMVDETVSAYFQILRRSGFYQRA